MTPSINRLANSAKELGEYILESEFDLLEKQYLARESALSLEEFIVWVKGYMYYNALVCICNGTESDITVQLEEDYEDLTALRVLAG